MVDPLRVFFGYDERMHAGATAFMHSAIAHARYPLALVPLGLAQIPDVAEGSNAFTFRRFLVPWLCGFHGWAIFVDGSDMLCRADLRELFALRNSWTAVQVVKHDYRTRHPRKYVGTPMESANEDYLRKQWASVMLINCGHMRWRKVTPEFIAAQSALELLQLRFIEDERIGDLPPEWNWLADEDGENRAAKLLHFTAGVPAFPAHAKAPMADEWRAALDAATTATG